LCGGRKPRITDARHPHRLQSRRRSSSQTDRLFLASVQRCFLGNARTRRCRDPKEIMGAKFRPFERFAQVVLFGCLDNMDSAFAKAIKQALRRGF
jgi:hypothetical protein